MKTQVAPYETAVKCLRIECTNGLTVRLTRYPVDLVMSNATVYQSGTGYDFTGYSATATMSPSAIDLEGFLGFAWRRSRITSRLSPASWAKRRWKMTNIASRKWPWSMR